MIELITNDQDLQKIIDGNLTQLNDRLNSQKKELKTLKDLKLWKRKKFRVLIRDLEEEVKKLEAELSILKLATIEDLKKPVKTVCYECGEEKVCQFSPFFDTYFRKSWQFFCDDCNQNQPLLFLNDEKLKTSFDYPYNIVGPESFSTLVSKLENMKA